MPTENDLAADLGDETPAEVTHDGFIAIDKHQKDVNVQHKRFRDEERGRVKERDRADAAEARIAEIEGHNKAVVVPEPPDPYSANYANETAERDDAIRRQAEQNATNDRAVAARKEKDDARVAEQNEVASSNVAKFDSNMVIHGLKPVEVKAAAETLIGYGVTKDFQDVLLEDPDGPLLVQYLAANPIESDSMNRMSNLSLVNHINSEVRAKALLLKPKTSDAPDPPITLEGGGAPETKESWESGAKYE
ncbi:MAG: hypothetical protein ACKVKT_03190 [Rhodospirillales bacterium]